MGKKKTDCDEQRNDVRVLREAEIVAETRDAGDGKIGGTIRFGHSQKARDIEADALDGIKRNMSVGYIVNENKRDGVDAKTGPKLIGITNRTP